MNNNNLTPSQRLWKARRERIAKWKADGRPVTRHFNTGNHNLAALRRITSNPNSRANSSRT